MRGNALETVLFQPYFGCTESFLKVLSRRRFQATRAMRAKQAVTALKTLNSLIKEIKVGLLN